MIKTKIVEINGRKLLHTWSDEDFTILRDGVEYEEAYDPIDTGRVYTETDIPIESESDAEEILNILLGGAE